MGNDKQPRDFRQVSYDVVGHTIIEIFLKPVILAGQLSEPLIIRVKGGARFHTDRAQYAGKYLVMRDQDGVEITRVDFSAVTKKIKKNTLIVYRNNGTEDDFLQLEERELNAETLDFDFVTDITSCDANKAGLTLLDEEEEDEDEEMTTEAMLAAMLSSTSETCTYPMEVLAETTDSDTGEVTIEWE